MAISSSRASTQDNTGGTQVATVTREDGAAGLLQGMVPLANKTTFSETSRTGLTGADAPTGGDLTTSGFAGSSGANLFDLDQAMACQVRATCGTASATLTGRLAFYDGSNNPIGMSETLTFTSDGTLRLGNASGDFVCRANLLVDVAGARKARFFVDSVSAGTWSIYARPV